MASKKKLLTAAIALGTAAALTLGGTFAWQSISQTALNESSDIVNPGGRLHSDMQYTNAKVNNSDIYVENFTDPDNGGETIFARVRLEEYMEIVMNYGQKDLETVEVVTGEKTLKKDANASDVGDATRKDLYNYTYTVHKFDSENNTDAYWKLNGGDEDSETVYYMPTFNKNKDSLVADINGNYSDAVGGISNRSKEQYDYKTYTADSAKTANEIYDGDVDTLDELKDKAIVADLIDKGTTSDHYDTYKDDVTIVADVEHTAKQVGTTNGLLPLADWLAAVEADGYDENSYGNYWVYDEDGWIYWTSPIKAGECTGLLLDSFELTQVMDDTWYYAINVVGQFCTAGDLGTAGTTSEDGTPTEGTGFFANGETISDSAKELLDFIGATGAEAKDDDDEDDAATTVSEVIALNDESGAAYTYTVTPGSEDAAASRAAWNMSASSENYDVKYSLKTGIYSISKDDESIGTFDKKTGVLSVNEGVELLGLTVKATNGEDVEKYEFYITHGSTIYMLFGNESNGLCDAVYFTSTDDADGLTTAAQAAFTGVKEGKITSCVAVPEKFTEAWKDDDYQLNKVTNVRFANKVQPTNMDYWFAYCGNDARGPYDKVTFDFTNLDTSKVTSMVGTFKFYYHDLNLSGWDTGNVTDMSHMFERAGGNGRTADLSALDTSNVTTMEEMFYYSSYPTLNLGTFDTSNVTTMERLFAFSDTTFLNIENWNTSKVTDMSGLFIGAEFGGTDFSQWDTSNVTTMAEMFRWNEAKSLTLTGLDTSKVKNLSNMFDSCEATSLDVTGLDTSSAEDMSGMFKFLKFDGMDFSTLDTSNATTMADMFWGCELFTSIDLSTWDTSKVTDMSDMFRQCPKLETLTIGENFKMTQVTKMDRMFHACDVLELDCSGWNVNSAASHNDFNASSPKVTLPTAWQ